MVISRGMIKVLLSGVRVLVSSVTRGQWRPWGTEAVWGIKLSISRNQSMHLLTLCASEQVSGGLTVFKWL